MRKWIVKFLRKSEKFHRGDKIGDNFFIVAIKFGLTQFASSNLPIFLQFCTVLRSVDKGRFSVHNPFMEKCMVTDKLCEGLNKLLYT